MTRENFEFGSLILAEFGILLTGLSFLYQNVTLGTIGVITTAMLMFAAVLSATLPYSR